MPGFKVEATLQPQNETPASNLLKLQPTPSLVGIPREVRDQIYDNLLTAYDGPEIVEDASPQTNFSLALFAVNNQIRHEAKARMLHRNILFALTIRKCESSEAKDLSRRLFESTNPIVCPFGEEFLRDNLVNFHLVVYGRRHCSSHEYGACYTFSRHTWELLVMNLWRNKKLLELVTVVTNHDRSTYGNDHFNKLILEPFSLIRNMCLMGFGAAASSPYTMKAELAQKHVRHMADVREMLAQHETRADDSMSKGRYADARLEYEIGIRAARFFMSPWLVVDSQRAFDELGTTVMNLSRLRREAIEMIYQIGRKSKQKEAALTP